jgi:Fur family transcriptional regulator, stress-responsive regulator
MKIMKKDLSRRLRQRVWRMTAQRRIVAEVLAGEHVHLTADEVYERAVARLPEISRATVYNTLKELTDLGEVLEVTIDARAKRYDPNTNAPHQHLVCERCGRIRDVHPKGKAQLMLPSRKRHGFVLTSVDIVFHGLCPMCANVGKRDRRRKPRRS